MPRSTRKSTTSWQRWAVHLADCTNVFVTTDIWWKAQRSVCIKLLSLQPSYMAQSRKSLIITTYDSLSCSISAPFSTSTGVTLSLNRWRSPASRPVYRSPWYAVQDISLRWGNIIAYQKSYFSVSSPFVIMTGHQRKGFKDCLKKSPWSLSYRPSLTVHLSREPQHLASHHQLSCLLLWKYLQVHPYKQNAQEEPEHYAIKPWPDL